MKFFELLSEADGRGDAKAVVAFDAQVHRIADGVAHGPDDGEREFFVVPIQGAVGRTERVEL